MTRENSKSDVTSTGEWADKVEQPRLTLPLVFTEQMLSCRNRNWCRQCLALATHLQLVGSPLQFVGHGQKGFLVCVSLKLLDEAPAVVSRNTREREQVRRVVYTTFHYVEFYALMRSMCPMFGDNPPTQSMGRGWCTLISLARGHVCSILLSERESEGIPL